jgi:branched-chain amino acid transport system ATP-binding protein
VLEVSGIDVFYGDAQALHQLSLQVRQGEVVTLVGSNGAGKTTTLRAISGLRPVVRGDVVFEGRSLVPLPAHRRAELGIASVPEGRELWPQLTVRENLELGAYGKAARRHLADSLERVYSGWRRWSSARCSTSSGGSARRG